MFYNKITNYILYKFKSLNTQFSIPQYFYTFSTDIDIGFDFNSLI